MKLMRNVFAIILCGAVVLGGLWVFDKASHYTMEDCEVVSVEDGVMTFVDRTDNEWSWEVEEGENYEVGQKVDVTMNTNGTDGYFYDDVIEAIN